MRIWSILLIKSDIKWCIHLSRSLFLYLCTIPDRIYKEQSLYSTWIECYCVFFLVCCGCDASYIVSVHIQCQASIYTLSLCRGHSWRVRLANQETLTPPGHLVSPLVCRGPWMSNVVLYCWCHSDSASVLLYFTSWNAIHQNPLLINKNTSFWSTRISCVMK